MPKPKTKPMSTAQLLVSYVIIAAARVLAPHLISKHGFPTTNEAKQLLSRAAEEFSVLKLDHFPEVAALVADLNTIAADTNLARVPFKREAIRVIHNVRRMEWEIIRPVAAEGAARDNTDMGSSPSLPGWRKDDDGEWRNPRYSSNCAPHAEGFTAEYDEENACAVITLDGRSAPVSLYQLHNLNGQTQKIVSEIQTQNSQLYREKQQLQFLDTGRLNPRPERANFDY